MKGKNMRRRLIQLAPRFYLRSCLSQQHFLPFSFAIVFLPSSGFGIQSAPNNRSANEGSTPQDR